METVRSILNFLLICLEVVFIFNLIIVVHELGHFLAGRWRGLVIEKFGIWFGKPIWKTTINGVQFSLGSIPFGGFVQLPQMAPMDIIEGETETPREQLPRVSALDKIIVAVAGPLFSLGLALVFAVIVWFVGRPVSQAETNTTIGYVEPGSPAADAGMLPGDKILEVDGHPVSKFGGMTNSVVWYVVRSEGADIPFKIQRGDQTLTLRPKPLHGESRGWWTRQSLRQVMIQPASTPMVAKIAEGSPAAKAGLKDGDLIEALDGQPLLSIAAFFDAEITKAGQTLSLRVKRGEQSLETQLAAPALPLEVEAVSPGSPAAMAGIRKGDTIVSLDGRKLKNQLEVRDYLKAGKSKPVVLEIARRTGTFERTLVPQVPEEMTEPKIGVLWRADSDGITWDGQGLMDLVHPAPLEQVGSSVSTVVNTIGAILSPRSDVKLQHLSGPVMIFSTYYQLFQSDYGWRLALWFSVILNVNLALLNMLPIPVLDGGHILLALIEAVRRKPVSMRILEVVQTVCFVMIAGYMLYVSFYDVADSPFRHKREREEVRFPARAASPAP